MGGSPTCLRQPLQCEGSFIHSLIPLSVQLQSLIPIMQGHLGITFLYMNLHYIHTHFCNVLTEAEASIHVMRKMML